MFFTFNKTVLEIPGMLYFMHLKCKMTAQEEHKKIKNKDCNVFKIVFNPHKAVGGGGNWPAGENHLYRLYFWHSKQQTAYQGTLGTQELRPANSAKGFL